MTNRVNELDRITARAMSPNVRRAVDVVRAAGEDVSDWAIEILERVARKEIDTEEAIRLIKRRAVC